MLLLKDGTAVPARIINDIQSLLLTVMCNVAGIFLYKKSSGQVIADQTERNCFVEAAIAFCKLQHLNHMIPVKTQVSHPIVLCEVYSPTSYRNLLMKNGLLLKSFILLLHVFLTHVLFSDSTC